MAGALINLNGPTDSMACFLSIKLQIWDSQVILVGECSVVGLHVVFMNKRELN